jgi:hypothetical protein
MTYPYTTSPRDVAYAIVVTSYMDMSCDVAHVFVVKSYMDMSSDVAHDINYLQKYDTI